MNSRRTLSACAAALSLVAAFSAAYFYWQTDEETEAGSDFRFETIDTSEGPYSRISGPFTFKNLSVFLVHGEDTLPGRIPVPLSSALERGLVVVRETGEVSRLTIENVSAKEEVFVQAGDIVRGGKQDRVITVDLIVPARSGQIAIDSFCVEQGRWNQRGSESAVVFDSSEDYAPSKEFKVAAKHAGSQQSVWDSVANTQYSLSEAANTNVASDVSKSSLPLSLENETVQNLSSKYRSSLEGIIEDQENVIGFVFAINGRINSAETYGSSELFRRMWPKLLRASTIEAVSNSNGTSVSGPKPAEIEAFLRHAGDASVSDKRRVTDRVTMLTREQHDSLLIESLDRREMLHRSYIRK
ncbi:MAG: hypothetical protein J5I65_14480 [Aridibacter famidurans]|nr:hypothetical protein [Aridibacter famidurans]